MFHCYKSLPLQQGLQYLQNLSVKDLSYKSLPLQQGLQSSFAAADKENCYKSLPLQQGLQSFYFFKFVRFRYKSLPLQQGLQLPLCSCILNIAIKAFHYNKDYNFPAFLLIPLLL